MSKGISTRAGNKEDDAMVARVVEKVLSSDILLDKFIEKLKDRVIDIFKDQLEEERQRVVALEARVSAFEEQVSKNVFLLEEHEQERQKVVALEVRVSTLEQQVSKNVFLLEEHEQYSRRNNLRLFGVVEKPKEDLPEVLVNICKQKLNIDLKLEDVDCCHRLGATAVADKMPRPVIVKFCRRSVRNSIYRAKTKLKGTKLVIREDLTRERAGVVKHLVEKLGPKNVFTENCNIFYKKGDEIKKISSMRDKSYL